MLLSDNSMMAINPLVSNMKFARKIQHNSSGKNFPPETALAGHAAADREAIACDSARTPIPLTRHPMSAIDFRSASRRMRAVHPGRSSCAL